MSDMTTKPPRSRVAKIARRTFLVSAGVIGGGLLVGAGAVAARLSGIDAYKLPAGEGETSFGAWLKFNRDGMVEIVVPHQEMGQGIYTLAVLLAAEGLKLPPEAIRPVPAPIHARFANPVMLLDGLPLDDSNAGAVQRATVWTFDKVLRALGLQATGGSTSTRNITDPIRACAASALDLLTQAAAEKFNVSASVLKFAGGTIVAPDGRSASYGELADAAAKLKPRDIALPPIALGTYVGRGFRALMPMPRRKAKRITALIHASPASSMPRFVMPRALAARPNASACPARSMVCAVWSRARIMSRLSPTVFRLHWRPSTRPIWSGPKTRA